jgi:Ras-related protein Rab-2A
VTNRQTFESLFKWYEDVKGFACDKIVLFIVGNKIDLEDRFY